jgi:hypothetical protein
MKGSLRDRLTKLFGLLGSDNAGERENARTIINEILRKNRKSWNDLTELLQTGSGDVDWKTDDGDTGSTGGPISANIHALDLVHELLEEHIELTSHEYVAIALWVLHTHVYNQFLVTPRLALVSPVRGCGKTTVLAFLALLAARGRKDDSISAAAIIRLVDREHCTLLCDEADNLGLGHNSILRAVLNSGHRKGGSRTLVIKDRPRKFSTFAPMAIASIGILPLPIMHRSLVIHMSRAARKLHRFDGAEPAINHAYTMIRAWARDIKLNPDPELPKELRNRAADNWRPLIAIADSFGRAWGRRARTAAVEFSRTQHDEDAAVVLLNDIRTVFSQRGVDRVASKTLVEDLVAMDDAGWADWRGLRDDQQPRRLSQGELARLLKPFNVRPKTLWPRKRNVKSKSAKGYERSQFTAVWAAYCDSPGTPSQSREFSKLR